MNITKILKNIAKMYEVLYNRGNEDCKENTKKFRIGGRLKMRSRGYPLP